MFSNPKKFFKKNMLLIGIVLIVILMVTYCIFMYTFKEGFDMTAPAKVKLIPVSTIEKFYNKLTDPNAKNIVAPIVELYKLFVANYDDVFAVSLQIIDAIKERDAAVAAAPAVAKTEMARYKARYDELLKQLRQKQIANATEDGQIQVTPEIEQIQKEINLVGNQLFQKEQALDMNQPQNAARDNVAKKWAPKINPGLIRVLSNAIKWLPTAKRYYDNFVSNNYYGLNPSPSEIQSFQQMYLRIINTLMNTLYEDDQLSIIFGPTLAKSNPNPPFKFPFNIEQVYYIPRETMLPLEQSMVQYSTNVVNPFLIIQSYLTQLVEQSAMTRTPGVPHSLQFAQGFIQNNVLTDTIIQLIEQLNSAVANDATDKATIGQLTGKLNTALANDARDQATITNLEGKLKTQQSNSILNTGPNMMPTWSASSTTTPPTITSPSTAATSSSPASWSSLITKPPQAPAPNPVQKAKKNTWG